MIGETIHAKFRTRAYFIGTFDSSFRFSILVQFPRDLSNFNVGGSVKNIAIFFELCLLKELRGSSIISVDVHILIPSPYFKFLRTDWGSWSMEKFAAPGSATGFRKFQPRNAQIPIPLIERASLRYSKIYFVTRKKESEHERRTR